MHGASTAAATHAGTVVELFGELRSSPDVGALQAGALAGAVSAAAALLQQQAVGVGGCGQGGVKG
jgi:hypothetical protein